MNTEQVMAMYNEHYPGDAGLIRNISDRNVFRSIVERMVHRKAPMVARLGLDDLGRRFFAGSPLPMADVARDLRDGDIVLQAWGTIVREICRLFAYTEDEKLRDFFAGWVERSSWSYRGSLLSAVEGADTLMFDGSDGRRVRLVKALARFGKDKLEAKTYYSFLEGIRRNTEVSLLDLVAIVIEGLKSSQRPSFLLSVNPYDMFLMSSDCPYDSCHKPHGLYPGAPWQYMADDFSGVLLHLPDPLGEFPWRKLGRAIVHCADHAFYLGRPYGTFVGNDTLGRNAANGIAGFIDEYFKQEPGLWKGRTSVGVEGKINGRRSAYEDNHFLAAWMRKPEDDPATNPHRFMYGMPEFTCADTFCPECGDEYQRDDTYERRRACQKCTGEAYDCVCAHCNEGCHREDTTRVAGEDRVCQSCYENHYRECPRCEEISESEDFRSVRYGSGRHDYEMWCSSCHEDYDPCHKCGYLAEDGHEVMVVDSTSVLRPDGTRVRRPDIDSGVLCQYCYTLEVTEECADCRRDYYSVSSRFPALIELRTMDGPHDTCRDCARRTHDAVHEDGAYWTPEALGEHRLDEMLAAIFANESPAIRSCLEEVGL